MSKFVYIAGPLTHGNPILNVRAAIEAADKVRAWGGVPDIPHLSIHDHFLIPRLYEFWITEDLERVARCDALYRIGGHSPGGDREVQHAHSLGIPVFYDAGALEEWLRQ